jgi:hypothetical protein
VVIIHKDNLASFGYNKGCVTLRRCHLHEISILRQKKNYENSNVSPCKNIIF